MAPVYLNPPHDHSGPFQLAEDQKHDNQHLQLLYSSSHNRPAASLSYPIFLNSSTQDQGMFKLEESQQHDQKIDRCIASGGSSDLQSSIYQPKIMNNKQAIRKREVGEGSTSDSSSYSSASGEWRSSKMRLMNKMINSSSNSTGTHDESSKVAQKLLRGHDNIEVHSFTTNSSNSNNNFRVCSDCKTTTTPLWRSGPRGPKSLCNACGIRQRKARRATQAAAESGAMTAYDNSSFTKIKLQKSFSREKKPRTSHVARYKKQCNTPDPDPPHCEYQSQRKLCFKDFALSLSSSSSALKQVFPQDVEEAAIMLMELSCGFIHT